MMMMMTWRAFNSEQVNPYSYFSDIIPNFHGWSAVVWMHVWFFFDKLKFQENSSRLLCATKWIINLICSIVSFFIYRLLSIMMMKKSGWYMMQVLVVYSAPLFVYPLQVVQLMCFSNKFLPSQVLVTGWYL